MNSLKLTNSLTRKKEEFKPINLDKISSTGWKPISVFDEKLEETVNWYQNNENWWKNEYENVKSNKRLKRSGLN